MPIVSTASISLAIARRSVVLDCLGPQEEIEIDTTTMIVITADVFSKASLFKILFY
jgi:hypothetical protein